MINVRDCDAVGNGIANDTNAFINAFGADKPRDVYVPRGNYLVDGVNIPDYAKLELELGATLITTQPVNVNNGSQFIGNSYFAPFSSDPFPSNVIWNGSADQSPLGVGVSSNVSGCYLKGIMVDGNNSLDAPVIQIGSWNNRNSANWTYLEYITALKCKDGVSIQGSQDCKLSDLVIYNPDSGERIDPSIGCGLQIGTTPATVTNLLFTNIRVQNFTTLIQIGGPNADIQRGVFHATFIGGYLLGLPKDNGCAIRYSSGLRVSFLDLQIAGPTGRYGEDTTKLFEIGTETSHADGLSVERCSLSMASIIAEGKSWQSMNFQNNFISIGDNQIGFLNTANGPVCRYGNWGFNYISGGGKEWEGSFRGFNNVQLFGSNVQLFGNRNQPIVQLGLTSEPVTINPGDTIQLIPPEIMNAIITIRDNIGNYGRIYLPGNGVQGIILDNPNNKFHINGTIDWNIIYDNAYRLHNLNGQPLNVNITTITI